MKINIKAKPGAREEKIYPVKCPEGAIPSSAELFNGVKKIDACFEVWVKEPPVKGKANEAIRNALAVYFKTGTANVKIISGYTSRNKIIEIL
ncbi:MAG: DUF167 domain-containing protein [Candidatus Staskawiczbacteria bacterium]|jgi:hypothetical protein